MKRVFDLVVGLLGLLLVSPVILTLAALIKWTSPGPVFYRGKRVGLHGKPFHIYKFRSMVINAEQLGGSSTSDGDPRVTPVGRFIRKYKLDELPQLINVVAGDMSLVGPRPEVQQYVDLYTEEEQLLLTIRPGITDWASIWNSDEGAILANCEDPDRGYEELIRPTKLRLQLAYAKRHNIWIDLKIIIYTLAKIANRDFLPSEVEAILESSVGEATESTREFGSVTELPGHGATSEQLAMLHTRYRFAADLCRDKDVLELACGPGVALGYLSQTARRVVGGDVDVSLVQAAAQQYGNRVEVREVDAQAIPYEDASFDVLLLLEAIYYLPDPQQFVSEARRVLRPGGQIFICSANRERPDFNPSPFTHRYYSAAELRKLLEEKAFSVELFAAFPARTGGLGSLALTSARKLAVKLGVIPKTMTWKIWVKRLLFGPLQPIPAELTVDETQCVELVPIEGARVPDYKVIYAVGRRAA